MLPSFAYTCWHCSSLCLDWTGHPDGRHCSEECRQETRAKELRQERRELVAVHGEESVEVQEFDAEVPAWASE